MGKLIKEINYLGMDKTCTFVFVILVLGVPHSAQCPREPFLVILNQTIWFNAQVQGCYMLGTTSATQKCLGGLQVYHHQCLCNHTETEIRARCMHLNPYSIFPV